MPNINTIFKLKLNFIKMKSIYLREANSEKMRVHSEKGYIQRMQQFAERDEPFTFSLFKETGRLHSQTDFYNTYDADVPKDCTNVMVYFGGAHIYLLSDGTWQIPNEDMRVTTDRIEELEEILYNKTKNNLK